MNIFMKELKANLRSLLIWGVIIILFITISVSKFSAYYKNPEMLAILDALPPALLTAFDLQAFNLTTISGFFGLTFTYYALILSIAATMWGSDIISKEERDKTVEFSLSMPVTRSHLVTSKTMAVVVNCVCLLLITWGISLISIQRYQPEANFYSFLNLCVFALFILQLIFLSIGVFLGCAMKRYKQASSVAVSLLLGTYFLSILSTLDNNLAFLKYFSPFKYFDASVMLHKSRIDPTFLGLSLAIILVSMAGAYLTYSRRDLYI
jgi:ABC-2 type transport system permease protein